VNELPAFELLRYRHYDHLAALCAFDLLQLNLQDVRPWPLEQRKTALKMLLRKSHPGIAYNRTFDVEGSIVFHHACKFGCEGIVSKRVGSCAFGGGAFLLAGGAPAFGGHGDRTLPGAPRRGPSWPRGSRLRRRQARPGAASRVGD
jgi:hypothetical protein